MNSFKNKSKYRNQSSLIQIPISKFHIDKNIETKKYIDLQNKNKKKMYTLKKKKNKNKKYKRKL